MRYFFEEYKSAISESCTISAYFFFSGASRDLRSQDNIIQKEELAALMYSSIRPMKSLLC